MRKLSEKQNFCEIAQVPKTKFFKTRGMKILPVDAFEEMFRYTSVFLDKNFTTY